MLQHFKSNITVKPELSLAPNGQHVTKLLAATTVNGKRQWINASVWDEAAEALAAAPTQPGDFAVVSLINPEVESYAKKDGSAGESLTGQVRALKIYRKGQKGAILALTVPTARELAKRDAQPELPLDGFPF